MATANNTARQLAVGTNAHVLTADSAETTGIKWAAAPPSTVAFYCSDINLPGTGTATIDVITGNSLGIPATDAARFVAPFAGSVIGIGVRLTTARTAGTCTFQVTANTSGDIGPTATINGTDTADAWATGAVGAGGSTFTAGELIRVRATGASFTPTTADVVVTVIVALTIP